MSTTSIEMKRQVVGAMLEGMSINSIVRLTGVAKTTVLRLVRKLGTACTKHHTDHVRGLRPESIECDEVWSFVHCKARNVATAKAQEPGIGDSWLWTALDAKSKVIISYHVGLRTPDDANAFMLDLSERVNNKPQITTDGLGIYVDAVRTAFERECDYAQLIKVYRTDRPDHARYSPAVCTGCQHKTLIGYPEPSLISTSRIERHNLTVRMGLRRFTRLTNAHSKTVENHRHAVAMFMVFYNFCRKHQTIGTSPAVKAGLADHVWTLDELVALIG